MSTLYDQLGGEAAIDIAVDKFYEKVLSDNRIKHFFDGIDMVKQKGHQKKFLTYAFGGLPEYTGRTMQKAHAKLVNEQGLNESHFNAVAENLQSTLEELNIPKTLIDQAMAIAASTKEDVLAG
jgi:hemoglobin